MPERKSCKLGQALWIGVVWAHTFRQHVGRVLHDSKNTVVAFEEQVELAQDVVIRYVKLVTKVNHALFLLVFYRFEKCATQAHRIIQFQELLGFRSLFALQVRRHRFLVLSVPELVEGGWLTERTEGGCTESRRLLEQNWAASIARLRLFKFVHTASIRAEDEDFRAITTRVIMVADLLVIDSPAAVLDTVLVHDGSLHLDWLAAVNELDLSLTQGSSPGEIDHLIIGLMTCLVLVRQELHSNQFEVIVVFSEDPCTIFHLVKPAKSLEHLIDQRVLFCHLKVRHVDQLTVRGLALIVGNRTSATHVELVQLVLADLVRVHIVHVYLVDRRCFLLHPGHRRLFFRRWVASVLLGPLPISLLLLESPFSLHAFLFLLQGSGILRLLDNDAVDPLDQVVILFFFLLRHRLPALFGSQGHHEQRLLVAVGQQGHVLVCSREYLFLLLREVLHVLLEVELDGLDWTQRACIDHVEGAKIIVSTLGV